MSSLQEVALGMLAGGTLGVLSMLVYIQACRWATMDLIPPGRRRRVRRWLRMAPHLIVISTILMAVGLALAIPWSALASPA